MQAYEQVGNTSPDVRTSLVKAAYATTQELIKQRQISAGHDISDGGVAVTLLEMAFAGNCGIQVTLFTSSGSAVGAVVKQFDSVSACFIVHASGLELAA